MQIMTDLTINTNDIEALEPDIEKAVMDTAAEKIVIEMI